MADESEYEVKRQDEGVEWLTEEYTPTAATPLAQEIFDKGLVFLLNQHVLHHYGYAIGVTLDEERRVTGLNLHKTDDPDGVWFDEATVVAARKKLREAGLR